jgi:hypothetical protein
MWERVDDSYRRARLGPSAWHGGRRAEHTDPLNMVEIFFRSHRPPGHPPRSLTSVTDLITAIRTFIDGWNDRCHPFTWTKTADEILEHATPKKRKETSFTRHQYPVDW